MNPNSRTEMMPSTTQTTAMEVEPNGRVQEGLLAHQPERDNEPDEPVGDEPVDQQRGDAPTEPGNRPGAGLGQAKTLTGIVVGS